MKKKIIVSLFALAFLAGCSTHPASDSASVNPTVPSVSLPDSSSASISSAASHKKSIYEELTDAFHNLCNSRSRNGKIQTASTDGTTSSQDENDVLIEIDSSSYYYLEEDPETHEHLVEENFFEKDGNLINRTINYTNNTISETDTGKTYASVRESPFVDLTVDKIKGIRERPNWYQLKDNQLASRIVYFISGYQTTGLPGYQAPSSSYTNEDTTPTVSEFAIHFNGDSIDQFRILLQYERNDDDSYYCSQVLFELDLSAIGSTVPRSIQPLEHTEGHDQLKAALAPYAYGSAKNYTVHVDLSYDTNQIQGRSYDYLIDFDKQVLFNSQSFTKAGTDDSSIQYNSVYQFEKDKSNPSGALYLYKYKADDTHEYLGKQSFADYWGYSSDSEVGTRFADCTPRINLLAPECRKDNGDKTFTTYQNLKSRVIRSLLPFDEYVEEPIYSGDFKVNLKADGSLDCFTNVRTANFTIDDAGTQISATQTFKVTFVNLGTTTIPSYCVQH